MIRRRSLLVAAAAITVVRPAVAAPASRLLPEWQAHNSASQDSIDHGPWDALLKRHVVTDSGDGINRVRYDAFSSSERQQLDRYLQVMQSLDPRQFHRDEQMPYWTNLYNALTVNLILKAQPSRSIKQTGKGWFSFGPWDDDIAEIQGKTLSLNDIEHRILRPIWQDQRIHFVVNCASLGCPDLLPAAFTRSTMQASMQQAAVEFVNHPRGVSLSKDGLVMSSIFDWYAADFGNNLPAVLDSVAHFADKDKAMALRAHRGAVSYTYDWNLNRA